jgi:hypothetical protein
MDLIIVETEFGKPLLEADQLLPLLIDKKTPFYVPTKV